MTGRVVRLVKDRMFGFILYGEKDYFFHREDYKDDWNSLVKDVEKGEQVLVHFDGINGRKGLRAANVVRNS